MRPVHRARGAAHRTRRCPGAAERATLLLLPNPPPARSTPASLSLAYGCRTAGVDYDRSLFGMQLADCRCLARALAHSETLVHLDL